MDPTFQLQLLRANDALTNSFDHLKKALKKKGLPSLDSLQNPESRVVDATTAMHEIETLLERILTSRTATEKRKTKTQKTTDALRRAYRSAYPFAKLVITIFQSGAQVLRSPFMRIDYIDIRSKSLRVTL
jgi:hypothetical protein